MKMMSLLSTISLVAMTAGAFAADLPSRRAPVLPPVPVPVFSWEGFYIGGQIGYAFGRDNASVIAAPGVQFPYSSSPDGFAGGAHVGYNYVLPTGFGFGSGLIMGVEGDVNGSDYNKTEELGGALTPALLGLLPNAVKSNIQGSVRGRLGVAVDRALFYVTGGVAFANFTDSFSSPAAIAPGLPSSFSHMRTGFTVGGGVEYAITPSFSLRGEYRYTDFGTFTDPLLFLGNVPNTHRETENLVQFGFSYRFATPLAPVVARY